MGSSGAQVSHGWLDTLKALIFQCCDSKDPRSESGPGVYRSHPMDDGLLRDELLNRQGPSEKKYYRVYYDQPAPMPPPRAQRQRSLSMGKVRKENKRAVAKQADIGWIERNFRSGKRKAPRPMISDPFDFQHTGTGAVSFMASAADLPRSAPPAPAFRPLELSIYRANDEISPLMPYFTLVTAPSPPQPALNKATFDEDASTLAHSNSYSSQSFHIPRRPVNDVASFTTATTSSAEDSPPRIPPRARTRPRAYTSPSVEAIVERIAGAMIEKERLEGEIESVKERQSFCLSRPSSVFGLDEDEEPMPPMPLMPPSGPSFAERLSIDRPRTAPSTRSTFEINPPLPPPPPPRFQDRSQGIDEPRAQQTAPSAPPRPVPASAFNSHPPWRSPKIIDNSVNISVPLAPPLPLILRPPLRKKKSFSRVSSWLFPAGVEDREQVPSPQHRREVSLDSVTNAPRALTDRDGYYQTLPPSAVFSGRRSSFGSMSDITRSQTHSVYSTDEDPFVGPGTGTATSNWSPGSTPPENARRKDSSSTSGYMSGHSASLSLTRAGTFGSRDRPADGVALPGPRPTSVGVAF